MDENSQETVTRKGYSIGIPLVIFGILFAAVIGFFLFGLYSKRIVESREPKAIQSTNCLQGACIGTTKSVDYVLDPKKKTYETVNYCTINAPPSSFVQALEACEAGNKPSSLSNEKITSFATFYNKNYVDSCGFSWKDRPVPFAKKPDSSATKEVQSDHVTDVLIGCAKKIGLPLTPDMTALEQKNTKNK